MLNLLKSWFYVTLIISMYFIILNALILNWVVERRIRNNKRPLTPLEVAEVECQIDIYLLWILSWKLKAHITVLLPWWFVIYLAWVLIKIKKYTKY